MPYLIQILIKFSLSLGIMFLFYQLVLRPLTFYQWNRFYLVCYSLLSFVIPFINVGPWLGMDDTGDSSLMSAIPVIESMRLPAGFLFSSTGEGFLAGRWNILYLVLVIGALVMMIRLFLQYLSLQVIKRGAVKRSAGAVQLYDVGTEISPFSFANAIFLNSRLHTDEELQKIIQHEFVHVKQKHTIDILIGELLCILNWFNPFAWLIRRAIRQNLEFIADHHVLETGLDARQYQYLLLKVVGIPQYSITTNFNLSSLKKRITMMNKMKTARVHLIKFLFILPILAVLLLAFRQRQLDEEQLKVMLSQPTPVIDTVPAKPLAPAAGKNSIPPIAPGTPVAPVAGAAPVTAAAPVAPVAPVTISIRKTDTVPVVPAVPKPPKAPALPANVESVNIDTKATITYKDGTKETYDFSKAEDKAAYERKFGKLPEPPAPPLKEVRINGMDGVKMGLQNEPLIIVDGKELPRGTDLNSIEPNTIESISVLKDKSASDLYEEKGANGVILITTRDKSKQQRVMERPVYEVRGYGRPPSDLKNFQGLIILDGKEVSKEEYQRVLSDQKTPVEIRFMKGEEAIKQYKDKGKDGVIIVHTETPKK